MSLIGLGDSGRAGIAACSAFTLPAPPSKEAFLNAVSRYFVDSGFSYFYVAEKAQPCSFIKYDYDDWVKYGMMKDVDIQTLNELAKKCYYDRKPIAWLQDSLKGAHCISAVQARERLDPLTGLQIDSSATARHRKKLIRQKDLQWLALPPQERTVFYFSLPEFTDDGEYAVMDLEFRCDDRQCGLGATWIFQHSPAGWIPVCKKTRWSTGG